MKKIHDKIFHLMLDKDTRSVVDLSKALDMDYSYLYRSLTVSCSKGNFMKIRKFLGGEFEPELIWDDHGNNHDFT